MWIIISSLILVLRDILFPEPRELAQFVNESDQISTFPKEIRGLSGWGKYSNGGEGPPEDLRWGGRMCRGEGPSGLHAQAAYTSVQGIPAFVPIYSCPA